MGHDFMKLKVILPIIFAIAILSLISIPTFVREPWTSPQNACYNNLRYIDVAKQTWGLENHKTNGPVSWSDIQPYLIKVLKEQGRKTEMPKCPEGGTYTLGNIEELPKCSIKGHSLMP
jgi:hypothetical protein